MYTVFDRSRFAAGISGGGRDIYSRCPVLPWLLDYVYAREITAEWRVL